MSNTVGDMSNGPRCLSDATTSVSAAHAVLSADTFASMCIRSACLFHTGMSADTDPSVSNTVLSADTSVSADSGACVPAYASMSHDSLSGVTAAAMCSPDGPQLSGTFGASGMSDNLGARMPVVGWMSFGSGLWPWPWQSGRYSTIDPDR